MMTLLLGYWSFRVRGLRLKVVSVALHAGAAIDAQPCRIVSM